MSMTKREAFAVQALLDWVLSLQIFEHGHNATNVLADDEFVRVVGTLADRSYAVFGAGLDQGDAIGQAMRLLGMPTVTVQAAVDVEDLELPANAGSSS